MKRLGESRIREIFRIRKKRRLDDDYSYYGGVNGNHAYGQQQQQQQHQSYPHSYGPSAQLPVLVYGSFGGHGHSGCGKGKGGDDNLELLAVAAIGAVLLAMLLPSGGRRRRRRRRGGDSSLEDGWGRVWKGGDHV